MKRILAIIVITGVVLGGLGLLFRAPLTGFVLAKMYSPKGSFESQDLPPAPDYDDLAAWAAHPSIEDNADLTPPGIADTQAQTQADVFFIHPTTYYKKDYWNGPIEHAEAKRFIDDYVMPGQASAFNAAGKIYAPRYRQGAFGAYFVPGDNADAAFDLAYQDVLRAFENFLSQNDGRPFIIAGHSQGAQHIRRLVAERVAGSPQADRRIAAYPIGMAYNIEELKTEWPGIPVCDAPEQTGCYVTWNTVSLDGKYWVDDKGLACVNPLNWKTDGAIAGHDRNKGAVRLGGPIDLIPGAADAQCSEGVLRVSEVRTDVYNEITDMGSGNYHRIDVSLYYMGIRENAVARSAAFLAD